MGPWVIKIWSAPMRITMRCENSFMGVKKRENLSERYEIETQEATDKGGRWRAEAEETYPGKERTEGIKKRSEFIGWERRKNVLQR